MYIISRTSKQSADKMLASHSSFICRHDKIFLGFVGICAWKAPVEVEAAADVDNVFYGRWHTEHPCSRFRRESKTIRRRLPPCHLSSKKKTESKMTELSQSGRPLIANNLCCYTVSIEYLYFSKCRVAPR